jgi:hypothetical protein
MSDTTTYIYVAAYVAHSPADRRRLIVEQQWSGPEVSSPAALRVVLGNIRICKELWPTLGYQVAIVYPRAEQGTRVREAMMVDGREFRNWMDWRCGCEQYVLPACVTVHKMFSYGCVHYDAFESMGLA